MGILDNAKQVAEAVHEIHNLELYQRVLSLHSDIIALVEDNNQLRGKVTELQNTLTLQEKMTHKPPFYFQEGDPTPFCQPCWEANKLAVHVIFSHDSVYETRWDCPTCKQMFLIRKNVPRPGQVMPDSSGDQSWMR